MIKKIALASLTLPLWGVDNNILLQRIEELENIVKQLKIEQQNVQHEVRVHEKESQDLAKIVEKVETKTLANKLNFSPEVRLRTDLFTYKSTKIEGENTTTSSTSPMQLRDEFTKNYDPALAVRVRLNMNSTLGEQARFFARFSINRNSQTSQRVCILSNTIMSAATTKTSFDVDKAYVDYFLDNEHEEILSFGILPTTGGTPTHYGENSPRKSVFPALVYDAQTYGAIYTRPLTVPFHDAHIRVVAGKIYTQDADAFYYQCNREIFKNGDIFGAFMDVVDKQDALRFHMGALRVGNIQAVPYLGPIIEAGSTAKNLGDIDLISLGFRYKGDTFTVFSDFGASIPHANGAGDSYTGTQAEVDAKTKFTTADYAQGTLLSHNGFAFYIGTLYPFTSLWTVGLEYNYGSRYWWSATQGSEDVFNKLATRGHVGEGYLIWNFAKNLFAKAGLLYTKEKWTGSGWHFGVPARKEAIQTNGYVLLNATF